MPLSTAYARAVCTAVADAATHRIVKEVGVCDQRVTPGSTFKITLSLMGYDSGYLVDEHSPVLPFKEGYPDWDASWRATTDPTSWIKNSVVWYSQQLTRWLGADRLKRYLKQFNYGNQDLSGHPGLDDGITQAWLSSSLQVSPLEQVDFLTRVVNRQLPVSPRAYDMTDRITEVEVLPGGWDVHGKTGTGYLTQKDGVLDKEHPIGWFVGWAKGANTAFIFAYLLQDDQVTSTRTGLRARVVFLKQLPRLLDGLRHENNR